MRQDSVWRGIRLASSTSGEKGLHVQRVTLSLDEKQDDMGAVLSYSIWRVGKFQLGSIARKGTRLRRCLELAPRRARDFLACSRVACVLHLPAGYRIIGSR